MTTAGVVAHILAQAQSRPGRFLVALAGPPASGKSTLSETLAAALTEQGATAEVVPMDGFHLDNRILEQRNLLARKGAPETFDLTGFHALIPRLRSGEEVAVPVFDRTRDIAIAGARIIGPEARILVVEGNYLAFDEPGWRDLRPLWDMTIFVAAPNSVLEDRLVRRWLDHGLGLEAARARAEGNDLPNARRILAARLPVDQEIASG